LVEGVYTWFWEVVDVGGWGSVSENKTVSVFVFGDTITEDNVTVVIGENVSGNGTALVSYVSPTPNSGDFVGSSTTINVSIEEANLANITFNWNGLEDTYAVNDGPWVSSEGLVLALEFDNRSVYGENDTFVYDHSGNENYGIGYGDATPNTSTGISGAFSFDGTDDRVIVADDDSLNISSFSISIWVYPRDLSSVSEFMSKDDHVSQRSWRIFYQVGGVFYSHGTGVGINNYNTGASLSLNEWHHLFYMINSTNKIGYVDGVKVMDIAGAVVYGGTSEIRIGEHPNGNYDFNGMIDRTYIWDRMLTETEILALNASGGVYGNFFNTTDSQWYYTQEFTNLADDTYFYNLTATDESNNQNITQTYNLTVDTTDPNATLLTPTTDESNSTGDYNFTANLTDATSGLENATLWIYDGSGIYNQTDITGLAGTTQQVVGIVVSMVEGVYTWFYSLFDVAGNQYATENRTFTASEPPLVEFIT